MHEFASWENFLHILIKPDNIPIAMMLPIVLFYTWWAFSEARKNDKLIQEGREDEVVQRMRE